MRSAVTASSEALARVTSFLAERFRPAAILLYGSHASGRAGVESGVDLGIVVGRGAVDPFALASAKIGPRSHPRTTGRSRRARRRLADPSYGGAAKSPHALAPERGGVRTFRDANARRLLRLEEGARADREGPALGARAWGLPDSLKDHFRILESERVVDADLAARLQAMVGFRNIAVHDYERIDRSILKAILRERLGDLESFANAVRRLLAA